MQQTRGLRPRMVGPVRTRRIPLSQLPFFWIAFNNSTGAILDQHNVSSLTDNGTNDVTVTYTRPATNGNYAVATGTVAVAPFACYVMAGSATTGFAATAARLLTITTDTGSGVDNAFAWAIGVTRR